MLKYLYMLGVISFAISSCKKIEKETKLLTGDSRVEAAEIKSFDVEQSIEIELPLFKYNEANEFALEYASLAYDYEVVKRNNDIEAIKLLEEKLRLYQKKGLKLKKLIYPDETMKFQNFLIQMEQKCQF